MSKDRAAKVGAEVINKAVPSARFDVYPAAMKRIEMLVAAVAVSGAVGAIALHSARAQTEPAQIKTGVDARIAALEQKVATLEAQNTELRNVIQISTAAGSVTIKPTGQLVLKGTSVAVESTGTTELKSSGTMTLKGALININ